MGEHPTATDTQDPGVRTLRRLTLGGLGVAAVMAMVAGLLGASGRGGLAVFLLFAALTSSLVGLVGVITMARDDSRGIPITRARIVFTIAGFAAATLLMAMVVGVGG